jgi:tyrosyl-tRNA synthetase
MAYQEVIDMGLSQAEREARSGLFIKRAIAEIYPSPDELAHELSGDRRLTAYMGIDPTAPDLHIGHESQLLKMRELQQLGHHVILLIGDFTGLIGDPTDKSAARVKQTPEEVAVNALGYKQQASKILDFDHPTNPIEFKQNSEWLAPMTFADVLELASEFTVQQMLERDMFEKRMADGKPLGLHELLYPTLQAWDSVKMDVDIELGGSDQIFNMLTGSTLVRRHLGKQKYVVAGRLLADPSGKKIGKSEGNMITMNDAPVVMFEKVMRFGDAIVPHALELCTDMPMPQIVEIAAAMQSGELGGLEAKKLLARELVTRLHSADEAAAAGAEYAILSSSDALGDIDQTSIATAFFNQNTGLVDALVSAGLASSKTAARRLVASGAVRLNGQKIEDAGHVLSAESNGSVLQVGKKLAKNYRRVDFGTAEGK